MSLRIPDPSLRPSADLRRQAEEIAAANELLAPFSVLRGIECDILPDGRLDLLDGIVAELDWVQVSVHGGQRMPQAELTKRVEDALRNPYVRCLSHPTGRYINQRAENALDLERVFESLSRDGAPRLGDCRKRPQHHTAAHDPRSASAGHRVILNLGSARVTSCPRG